ncbi:MAG TPA: hypothetical protein VH482_21435, partial [Thermomicrobiales bacterium]
MARQRFKSIYFTDYPAEEPTGRHVKVAFGVDDDDLFEQTRLLSGQDLRELLGFDTFVALRNAAHAQGDTINGYCLGRLREQLALDLQYRTDGDTPSVCQPVHLTGLQATFKGGAAEPMHLWYPYLEGYSPQFVSSVLDRYAPKARVVLDPFSGTGTTPLTVARRGAVCYFSEVNPLLQLLTEVKVDALRPPRKERTCLSDELERIAAALPDALDRFLPSLDLTHAYQSTFGTSVFFDETTFDRVLRCRAFLDDMACRQPLVARLVEVAVLASLVPSSLLTRAGDLRYKTPSELARERVEFVTTVEQQLQLMAGDLRRLTGVRLAHKPLLLAEDAKRLRRLPMLNVDAVVTSPPYLNGTNYFRNTKLELWFLRCLRDQGDLASFRTKSVTAGINDVSRRREVRDGHPSVRVIVQELSTNAYDARIPKMVHSYFQDMSLVFEGLASHVTPGATVAIDIGDSAYGGIRVPTDRLLTELLEERDFELVDEVVLRRRLSR